MRAPTHTLRIERRPDGRFVTRGDVPADSPLGVDSCLSKAIGTAIREATMLSRQNGWQIGIEVEQDRGGFKIEQIVNPPLKLNRKPRAAAVRK
jgi:hypothetical protein